MNLKRRKCNNISEMFQACTQPSERQPTTSRPPTRVDDSIHTPPPTIGLEDVTPVTSPHIDEANVAANSDSIRSGSIRSDSIRSSSEPSSELPLCWVQDGHFMPRDKEHVNEISRIIMSGYTGIWPTYKSIPQNTKDQWWAEFQTSFKVEPQCKRAVRKLFNKKASDCLTNALYTARQKWFGKHELVDWIDQEVMDKLVEYWQSEDFKNRSTLNKTNRNRVTLDGRGVAKSNGGSRSTYDTKLFLDNDLEREVCSAEVYIYMHTSKTTKLPVDNIAAKNQETLKQALPHFVPYIGQKRVLIPDEIRQEADKVLVDTLLDSAGGEKNGRISGLGNLSLQYSQSSRPPFSTPDVQILELTQQVSELTNQNRLLNEKIQEMAAQSATRDAEMAARDTARETEMAAVREFMAKFSNSAT